MSNLMEKKSKSFRRLGIVFYSIGILIGVLVFTALSWARLEAYFYFGYSAPADERLRTLKCPRVMTAWETRAVTISLTNPTDETIDPQIRTEISYEFTVRPDRAEHVLAPGETRQIQWAVTSDDVVFGHLILAKVYVGPATRFASRDGICGILVVGLPGLTGDQLLAISLAACLLCMALGWGLWLAGNRPMSGRAQDAMRAMILLTAVVLAGLLASFMGWWVVGVLCLTFSLLLIGTVLGHFAQSA